MKNDFADNDIPSYESYAGLGDHDDTGLQGNGFSEYESLNNSNGNGFHFEGEQTENESNESNESTVGLAEESFADNFQDSEIRELSEFESHNLQKEIEGIDFYVAQGFSDLAEKAIAELEDRYGKRPELDQAREAIKSPYSIVSEDKQDSMVGGISQTEETFEGFESLENSVENKYTFEDESETSDEESESKILGKLTKTEQYYLANLENEQYKQNRDYKFDNDFSNEIHNSFGNNENTNDSLPEPVEKEVLKPENIVSEKTSVEVVGQVKVGNRAEESFDELIDELNTDAESFGITSFDEFKSEVISEVSHNDKPEAKEDSDFDYRYQMGIAYKEMGLMEDAIKELQEAIKVVSADDGTRRFFWCCNLLGHCFIEKGLPNIALMWYKRGLDAKYISEEEAQGLRYELANAYEMAGDKQMAIRYFEEIYALSVGFRDVGKRLENLMTAKA